jgi:hypothetical protein
MRYHKAFAATFFLTVLSQQTAYAEVVISGEFGLSAGSSILGQTDDNDADGATVLSFAVDGSVSATFNDWVATFDAYAMRRDDRGLRFDQFAPSEVSSIGLHFGRDFGPYYAGAFIGKNFFEADTGTGIAIADGHLFGIEGAYVISDKIVAYGHFGRADMVGNPGDIAFDGFFGRLGVTAELTEKINASLEFEAGSSEKIFEDEGDSGTYFVVTVASEYQISERLIATASFSHMAVRANTEDAGDDTQVMVGLRVPFGAAQRERGNLSTSYRPGLVAAWAETLD